MYLLNSLHSNPESYNSIEVCIFGNGIGFVYIDPELFPCVFLYKYELKTSSGTVIYMYNSNILHFKYSVKLRDRVHSWKRGAHSYRDPGQRRNVTPSDKNKQKYK